MLVNRNIKWRVIVMFSWKRTLFFLLYGSAIFFVYHTLTHIGANMSIPFLPLSVIGIAVAFYVGFKNNQSYDRFWEARKIWGSIVNYSRTWGNQVMSFCTLAHTNGKVSEDELGAFKKQLIYRQMAWMNALRLQLRKKASHSKVYKGRAMKKMHKGRPQEEHWKDEVGKFILDKSEVPHLIKAKNTATQLIRMQGEELKEMMAKGVIEDFRHMELMGTLTQLYNFQGMCERIKNTPLPRQYSYFSHVFVWIFTLLLPFGLLGEFEKMGHDLAWLAVPFYVLIAWIFNTMESIGDNSEDPFENFMNDVPMTALCRTIEIDLRDMLGEEGLPTGIQAEHGVLM